MAKSLPNQRLLDSKPLSEIIEQLQSLDFDWKIRLAQAAFYYEKLCELMKEPKAIGDNITNAHLYQMLPSLIQWNDIQKEFQFSYPTYSKQSITYKILSIVECQKF